MNLAKDQMSQTKFILFAIATGAVTFFLFPVISYTSVIFYGLPAAAFILLGCGLWLFLTLRNPRKAFAFAVGFIPPVVFCLMVLLAMKPLYVGMILLPVACFWLIHKLTKGFRLK